MKIGYARVSSEDQNLARQLDALKAAGCENIYAEKVSGANPERLQLKEMLRYIREGDTLVISSLDRLGRSAADLLRIVDTLREKKVELESLKEKLDTSTPTGRFTLQIFAAVAELERESIRERQKEGIEAAKRRGTKLGRPSRALPAEFRAAAEEVYSGKCSKYSAAKRLGLPYQTFSDAYKRTIAE
ncbi:MAG TPA: recombinase family protein [Rectinemataceae bacterium]|nr:recombinase family protein [Rectinemataceae bacterium]